MLDENPLAESDLLGLYGITYQSVLEGRFSVHQVGLMLERLPLEPKSLWRAEGLGSLEFVNWSPEVELLADQFDILSMLVTMIGSIGSKGPTTPPVKAPRPGQVKSDALAALSELEEFNGLD